MEHKNRREELRSWLRRGDPAADGVELPDEQLRRMRQRILATSSVSPSRLRLLPLAALAVAAALSLVLLWPRAVVAPADRMTSVRPAAGEPSASTPRQIQFTTDGGTRIVWTLDPDFEL